MLLGSQPGALLLAGPSPCLSVAVMILTVSEDPLRPPQETNRKVPQRHNHRGDAEVIGRGHFFRATTSLQ